MFSIWLSLYCEDVYMYTYCLSVCPSVSLSLSERDGAEDNLLPYFLRHSLSLAWSSPAGLGWLVCRPQGPSFLHLWKWEFAFPYCFHTNYGKWTQFLMSERQVFCWQSHPHSLLVWFFKTINFSIGLENRWIFPNYFSITYIHCTKILKWSTRQTERSEGARVEWEPCQDMVLGLRRASWVKTFMSSAYLLACFSG